MREQYSLLASDSQPYRHRVEFSSQNNREIIPQSLVAIKMSVSFLINNPANTPPKAISENNDEIDSQNKIYNIPRRRAFTLIWKIAGSW